MNFDTTYLFKKIESLHKASEKAAERNRFYLFATIFACILLCVGIYNNLYSWDTHLNVSERPGFGKRIGVSKDSITGTDSSTVEYRKTRDIIGQMYLERHYINVPIFGFKFSVNDVSVIGSVALCVLVTLFFFSNRREFWINQEAVETFLFIEKSTDTDSIDLPKKEVDKLFILEYIFHGCIQNYLFTTSTKDDYLPLKANIPVGELRTTDYETNSMGRNFMNVLYILPIATLFLILCTDIYTLYKGKEQILADINKWYIIREIIIRFSILVVSLIYCSIQIYRSMCVFKLSRQVLNYMYETTKTIQDNIESTSV
jgi:hypothetical protein